MIILLSPSKTLNFTDPSNIAKSTQPIFMKEAKTLVNSLKKLSKNDLMSAMSISYKLAETNYIRFRQWNADHDPGNALPAFSAYNGDVYEGLKAWELTSDKIEFAAKHVRIISGLYGIIRPTDLIMPYRLEMSTPIKSKNADTLYEFWGDKITKHLASELKQSNNKVIVNLASAEYSKAVNLPIKGAKLITPFFKEFRNGEYKFITLSGKKARGLMTRYIIDNEINEVEELKLFNYEGYSYNDTQSKDTHWVFTR